MPLTDLNSSTGLYPLVTVSAPRDLQVTLLVIQVLEALLILVVNSVTLMTLVRIPSLRTLTSQYILNLSVADLLACLLPVFTVLRYNSQPAGSPWSYVCLLEKLVLMTCLLGNMTFALGVAIDRYLYMAYPLRYDCLVTPTRVHLVIAGTWVFIICQTLIVGVLTHMEGQEECYLNGLVGWGTFYIVVVVDFCSCLLLSLAVLGKYLLMSWKQSRQTGAWMGSVAVAGNENKEMSNLICGVVLIHAVCFSPSFVIGVLLAAPSEALLIADAAAATTLLINSWIKPFVYFWKNKLYQSAFKDNFKDLAKGYFAPRPTPPRVIPAPP